MKVKISEIEKIALLLLSKLKESKGDEIELSNDFIGIFLRKSYIIHTKSLRISH
jgi:hypothetical protein